MRAGREGGRKWRPIAGVSARVDKAMRRELIGHYCCVITRQLLATGSEESVKGHGVRGVPPGGHKTHRTGEIARYICILS